MLSLMLSCQLASHTFSCIYASYLPVALPLLGLTDFPTVVVAKLLLLLGGWSGLVFAKDQTGSIRLAPAGLW